MTGSAPAQTPSPGSSQPSSELTGRAIALGLTLSVVLSGANAYLGLFAGMTVSASIPAAVLSMALLRAVKGGLLENNLVQTAASAGESAAAGAIFTLPALVLLGVWRGFPLLLTTVLVALGGVLGVLFTIPLRRVLVDSELPFPEGVATAQVLRAGHAAAPARESGQQVAETTAGRGARALALGGLFGGTFKLCEGALGLFRATLEGASVLSGRVFYFGLGVSPALAAVGYLVGLRVAAVVLAGGLINWMLVIPFAADASTGAPVDAAWAAWSEQTRFLGVGAMSVGGLWTLIGMRKALGRAVLRQAVDATAQDESSGSDLSRLTQRSLLAVCSAGLLLTFWVLMGGLLQAAALTVLVLVLGFLFCSVAGYMAGLVGSSNNPVSGVTLATILVTALLLLLFGVEARVPSLATAAGPAAAVVVGSVICVAAAIGGDNMQDLKAGRLLGATPWRQQVMQLLGVLSAACVMAPVLTMLYEAYGFGAPTESQPDALRAPQATLMASVAAGVFGGDLPWDYVIAGAALALLTLLLDEWLVRKDAGFRVPVLALAVGVYLPLELSVPVALGGLAHSLQHRWFSRGSQLGANGGAQRGLLVGAGLITGEALVGIVIAAVIAAQGSLPSLFRTELGWPSLLGLLGALALLAWPASHRQ